MCPLVRNIPNGRVDTGGHRPVSGRGGRGYLPDVAVTYSCSAGYRLDGEQRRVCGPNGEWGSPEPRCSKKQF